MASEGNFAPVLGGESDSDVVYAQLSTDANNNTVLVGPDGDYAAIPVDSNGKAIVVGGGGHLRDTHAARGGLGDLLVTWDETPTLTNASKITDLSVISPDPDYSGYVAKLDGTGAAGAIYEHVPAAPIALVGVKSISFSAMAPVRPSGEHYAPFKIMFGSGSPAWTVYGSAITTIKADGEWHTYTMPITAFAAAGGWTAETAITAIRLREGDGTDGRTVLAVGESIYVGAIRKNPRGKAVGMIRFDDNVDSLHTTPVTIAEFVGASGVTVAAGDYTSSQLVTAFGFKATAYVLTDLIGEAGFETQASLLDLQNNYGWDIAFQAKANPVGVSNTGIRLLGPIGYGLVPVGGVASVDAAANTITCSAAHGVLTTGNSTGQIQGFPVEFIGTDLPAPLVTGTKYWLSATSTTVCKAHTSAYGSVNGTDIVDLTTAGTAANFGIRYWGSANDYTAILAEFVGGREYLRSNGFKAYDHYALNQGAYDLYSEQAAIEVGFKTAWSIGLNFVDWTEGGGWRVAPFETAFRVNAAATPTGLGQFGVTIASWINIPSCIQTDGVRTEAEIRGYVRKLAAYGLVGGNYHHSLTLANAPYLLAYLDELKVQSDRGLLDVMTITEFQRRVEASV